MPPTLLLADDSLTIQRVVSLTFADQAIRVVVAKDGQDAINRMTSERPDLVLADTNMPCVDGYELARWVRQQPHLNAVPVLLLAGATDPVDEQRLHDSGANGVLEKPFEPSHVISRVKELLGMKTPPASAPTRLVTTPETAPARPGSSGSAVRPPGAGSAERPESAAGTAVDATPGGKKPGSGIFRTVAPAADAAPAAAPAPAADEPSAADGMIGGLGDARDWFAEHEPAPSFEESSRLAEELGVSGPRFHAPAGDRGAGGAVAASSNAAEVFESLLAAEQGAPAPADRPVALTLTPEMLDRLFADTRAAVTAAVQAAIDDAVLGSIRGAVSEAVAAGVPAAVAEASTRVERAVREVVAHEIREIVHETSERMVSEEIARIRGRR